MKKYKVLLIYLCFFLSIFWLCTCQNNVSSYHFALDNFVCYKENLISIAEENGYTLTEEEILNMENQKISHSYEIKINESESIYINLKWLKTDNQKGKELYDIVYEKDVTYNPSDIDETIIDFYVNLINSISKKEVSSKLILAEVDNVYAESRKIRIPQDFMENHLSFVSYQSIGRFKVQTEGVLYKTNRMW